MNKSMNYELLNAKILDQGGTGNILLAIVFSWRLGRCLEA